MVTLARMRDEARTRDGVRGFTTARIREAMVCITPLTPATAAVFCELMRNIGHNAQFQECRFVHEAGAIPILFDCLRLWPANQQLVFQACLALGWVCSKSSAEVKKAVRDMPDCEALLRAAHTNGFDCGWAAKVLRMIGLHH
jgi:hypothetical protein